MLRRLAGIILGEIIWESSNWQHINRLKITILGANLQLFRLERIAKCSYFILSTQNIKVHWTVMKIKKFLLPIWWYNIDLFPHSNKYNVVFILNGLNVNQTFLTVTFFYVLSRVWIHPQSMRSAFRPSQVNWPARKIHWQSPQVYHMSQKKLQSDFPHE